MTILHRNGSGTSIPMGANRAVAGVGRCSGVVMETPRYGGESPQMLRVVCESPAGFPLEPIATLSEPGEKFGQPHQFPVPPSPWPASLSPVERTETSFPLAMGPDRALGKLGIIPDSLKGWAVVNLELHGIRLSDYELR